MRPEVRTVLGPGEGGRQRYGEGKGTGKVKGKFEGEDKGEKKTLDIYEPLGSTGILRPGAQSYVRGSSNLGTFVRRRAYWTSMQWDSEDRFR